MSFCCMPDLGVATSAIVVYPPTGFDIRPTLAGHYKRDGTIVMNETKIQTDRVGDVAEVVLALRRLWVWL